jgi:hypothetical protein
MRAYQWQVSGARNVSKLWAIVFQRSPDGLRNGRSIDS